MPGPLTFSVKSAPLSNTPSDCIVVFYFEKATLSPEARQLDIASKGALKNALKLEQATGKIEETVLLRSLPGIKAHRVLLVGAGNPNDLEARDLKKLIITISQCLKGIPGTQAHLCLDALVSKRISDTWLFQHTAQWLAALNYEFKSYKSQPSSGKKSTAHKKISRICFLTKTAKITLTRAAKTGNTIAEGMRFARDLGNTPGNDCHPSFLAAQARKLSARSPKLTCQVLDEKELRAMGAGAFCAVAQGSKQPGKLIILHYKGSRQRNSPPYTFVGKGITFDTGGISIKPSLGMEEMKYDMCGAATVLGLLHIVTELALPINVTGIIAAAENMPSGEATRPGDIIKTLSGKTVEIQNTDAEGRLVLCDALTYIARFNPKVVVDIATLTGACVIALGHHHTGLIANNQSLADKLLSSGHQCTDWAWQLPLTEEYTKQLDNPIADLSNIGGRTAGTITAGAFLAEFTKDYQWAHLDIAGTAWNSSPPHPGATGRPVPLLANYLINEANS